MAENPALLSRINVPKLAFFFAALLVVSLVATNAMRSLAGIATIGLAVTAILAVFQHNMVSNIWKYRAFLSIMLLYGLHLTGFLYPDMPDAKTFERDIVMKLPLLILPFAFAVLPPISRVPIKQLFYLFVVVVFLGSFYSAHYYVTNYHYVNELYIHSKVMLTPTNHVRFSLMVGFAVIIGFTFIREKFYVFGNWEKWLLILMTGWLFIFLHVLAVRSGLVAFYAVAGLGLAFDFLLRKKYKSSLIIGLGLLLSLVLAFFTLPTFYNKFFLTIEDMQRVSEVGTAHDYSIAGRVYSFKVATEIFKENPLTGVGLGNLDTQLDKKYDTMFPEILQRGHILPHNQFVYVLAIFGLLGLLVFLFGFYYPLFKYANRFEPFFLIHYFIITFSFIFETTLETQVGLNYSLVFILLPLWHFRANQPAHQTWQNGTFFS